LENTGIVEIPKKVDRRREVVKNEIWLSIQSRPYLAWAIRLRRMQRPAFWIEGGDYVGKVMGNVNSNHQGFYRRKELLS
jgi:hypothetical protein